MVSVSFGLSISLMQFCSHIPVLNSFKRFSPNWTQDSWHFFSDLPKPHISPLAFWAVEDMMWLYKVSVFTPLVFFCSLACFTVGDRSRGLSFFTTLDWRCLFYFVEGRADLALSHDVKTGERCRWEMKQSGNNVGVKRLQCFITTLFCPYYIGKVVSWFC